MKAILLAFFSVLASAAGQLMLALGTKAAAERGRAASGSLGLWVAVLTEPRVIFGIACWGASALLWMAALQRERLSAVYALASLNYVLVPLLARVVLGERIGGLRLIGMAVIVVGVGLCVAGRGAEGS